VAADASGPAIDRVNARRMPVARPGTAVIARPASVGRGDSATARRHGRRQRRTKASQNRNRLSGKTCRTRTPIRYPCTPTERPRSRKE
jgi:hypothetical protein